MSMEPVIGERRVEFVVSEELYPLDVIQGASYLFIDRCYVWLDRPADKQVKVVLRSKGAATPAELEALAGEFSNELLNQALRKNIGDTNAKIREFVMARAFFAADMPSTVDRLLAELDAEEMAVDPLEISVPWDPKAGGRPPAGPSNG
jgi:His-Xaa-Ser system protein HxsD